MTPIIPALITLSLGQGAQEMRLLRYPTVSGDKVFFTYASDLWTAETSGGMARRLTTHPNNEYRARVSRDGNWIAYSASYDGNLDVYVMPSEGGEPRRLTFNSEADLVTGWTPQGKIAFTSQLGSTFGGQSRLHVIDPQGGLPERTPIPEVVNATFSPDGKKVAYNRIGSDQFNWRKYRGGSHGKISIYDLERNTYSEIPNKGENAWYPMWVGDSIYFVSDKEKGGSNLYKFDTKSNTSTKLTDFSKDIKWPSTDGKTIVFENDTVLYSFDLASKKLTRLNPRVLLENLAARPYLMELGTQVNNFAISPSGNRLAVEARGEIFSVPARRGETRNVTNTTGAREQLPDWSPDGKWIAYTSDATGECEIYIRPQMGGEATKLTTSQGPTINSMIWSPDSKKIAFVNQANDFQLVDVESKQVTKIAKARWYSYSSYSWSPDSKWIAYLETEANLNSGIRLFELATNKSHTITDHAYDDHEVAFDANGKYLYFSSSREVEPTGNNGDLNVTTSAFKQRIYMIVLDKGGTSPLLRLGDEEGPAPETPKSEGVSIDLEGLAKRIVPLPMPAGTYYALTPIADGVLFHNGQALQRFDLKSRTAQTIISGALQGWTLTPSKSKIAFLSNGILGTADLAPNIQPNDNRVPTSDMETVVVPREEWKQAYWEAWRYQRDNYFDPNFKGMNWREVGDHYAGLLPWVSNQSDLVYVIGLMIGELGTSHAYVVDSPNPNAPLPIPTGKLGADYEVSQNRIRFKRIYEGDLSSEATRGPLTMPGLNISEGDYLLEIDGEFLDGTTPPDKHLLNKVNRTVILTVNSTPSLTGARKVRVVPTASEAALRYQQWIADNRAYVAKKSGGKIGYLHVPDTSFPGAINFVKGYYAESAKEALIVDERFNGGGFSPDFFIDHLARQFTTQFRSRNGADMPMPAPTHHGPKALLINQHAGSGGDTFAFLFKRQKLGPAIGTRTWGGIVGINGFYSLMNGVSVSAPEYALFDPTTGEWIAENFGIEPDIEVDARPDLLARGIDPQMDKAIEYLLSELNKKGPRKVKEPVYRKIN